ncbi:MAG: substrate-binding domain-containing protein [Caldilineaceae bacterium]
MSEQSRLLEKRFSRRRFMQTAGAGASMALLAACVAPAAGPAAQSGGAAAAPAQEKVALRVTHSWDSSFWPRQVEFDDTFNSEHEGIEVTSENIIWAEYVPKLTTLAAAGELPDLMYCQFAWAQRFIMDEAVITLQPFLEKDAEFWGEDDFNPESLKSYKWDNQLYFIPYDEGPTGLMFYNKDIFDEAGVDYPKADWTFDEMLDTAIKLTKGEGEDKIWGYDGLPGMGGDLNMAFLAPWGGRWWTEPCETSSVLDSEESITALEWWVSLRLEHNVTPTPAEQATLPGNAFAFGRQAMMKGATWNIPWINASLKANWDIQHYPTGPVTRSCSSMGSGYGITRDTSDNDAAWEYLRNYLSTEGQIYMWASTGRGSPARWSAWPEWLKSPLAPQSAMVAQEALEQYAKHEPLDSPFGKEISDVSQPIWDRAMLGEISVREAVTQIQEVSSETMLKNQDWASKSFPGECAA